MSPTLGLGGNAGGTGAFILALQFGHASAERLDLREQEGHEFRVVYHASLRPRVSPDREAMTGVRLARADESDDDDGDDRDDARSPVSAFASPKSAR